MVPQGGEPPGAGHPFDGRYAPDTRRDKRSTGRDIYHLSCAAAQHRMHAGLDEESEMGIGTQAPIGHEYIPWVQARMDRWHPGQIVGEEGRDHQLQEHTGARWNSPSSRATGKPHPGRCSVGWPNVSCKIGVSGMGQPEPSTTKVR
jgi:hypothetical protein